MVLAARSHMHARLTDQSTSSALLSCDITLLCHSRFDQGWLSPSRELLQKPAGTSQAHVDPAPHEPSFDASAYKHGNTPTVLFQSKLMDGLQPNVTDRHLGERDSCDVAAPASIRTAALTFRAHTGKALTNLCSRGVMILWWRSKSWAMRVCGG